METKFKLGAAHTREFLSAAINIAPFYARNPLAKMLESTAKGREVMVTVETVTRKHTDAQRGFYRMCVGMFAKHYKADPDDIHNIVLMETFGANTVDIKGKLFSVPVKRSKNLSVAEYSELIETLHALAAMAGFPLPDPSEVA